MTMKLEQLLVWGLLLMSMKSYAGERYYLSAEYEYPSNWWGHKPRVPAVSIGVEQIMKKVLILFFMVQMVAIQGMATNHVMRESFPDDSLHTGIWKTDTLKEVCIKGSSILQSGDRMKVAITKDLRRGTVSAIQMLGKLPNFTYNFVDRSLTYHNSSNIIVLVDSVEKDMNYLQNIQHIRFDKVEVIDKPQG